MAPKRIQAVMGHGRITMTFDLYGHLFESVEADREDMKKLRPLSGLPNPSTRQDCDMRRKKLATSKRGGGASRPR